MTINSTRKATSLRAGCLSLPDVFSQAIALVSPTATAALNAPFVFGIAGNGTWFAYVLATIGLVLVSVNINHFARRSGSAGTLYTSVAKGLGPAAGVVCGWALVLAYLFVAGCVTPMFAHFLNLVLSEFGMQVPFVWLYVLCIGIAWYYAFTDIRLSVVLMLSSELLAVGFITLLAFITLSQHGFKPDMQQLTLAGATPSGISLGMVIAVLSFVGFESAATLGDEARSPRRAIPRSVIACAAFVGTFFVLIAYTEVLAFRGYSIPLNESTAPLTDLARIANVELLGVALNVGVAFSFLSCALACFNAGGRIAYSLARHGVFPAPLGQVHPYNATPHIAITLGAAIMLVIVVGLKLLGLDEYTIYGYVGTIGTYGFLVAYILVSIAAPVYLAKQGELRPVHIVVSLLAGFVMLIPVSGSFYPMPAFPYNLFPYLFLVYLGIGFWLYRTRIKRSPQIAARIVRDAEPIANS